MARALGEHYEWALMKTRTGVKAGKGKTSDFEVTFYAENYDVRKLG